MRTSTPFHRRVRPHVNDTRKGHVGLTGHDGLEKSIVVYGSLAEPKALEGHVLKGPAGTYRQPVDVIVHDATMAPELGGTWIYKVCGVLRSEERRVGKECS